MNDLTVDNVGDRLQFLCNQTFSLTHSYESVINHLNGSDAKESKETKE